MIPVWETRVMHVRIPVSLTFCGVLLLAGCDGQNGHYRNEVLPEAREHASRARVASGLPSPSVETTAAAARLPVFAPDQRQTERAAMVRDQVEARGVRGEAVLNAMCRVPRHLFVPPGLQREAYGDYPLPIEEGQTISQPYIVGFMTEQLDLKPTDRVLEIGTGSGYQAAILAELVAEVFTVEIIPALGKSARERLASLGYTNIRTLVADGYHGWKDHAPFDSIIVTAAATHVPPPLIAQLRPGGRLVIPVGSTPWTQDLLLVTKGSDGKLKTRVLLGVSFVPLTRGDGAAE